MKPEKFWDNAANTYDQEEKNDEQTYKWIIQKTKKYLKISDTVLDYGCGTGLISNEVADNVKMIYGIDLSSKMIEIAKKKANECKIENIEYSHSTIFDKHYKKESFDVILSFYILHLLEDPDMVMLRINELLKPGGLIISATPCLAEKRTIQSILISFASKIGLVPNIKSFKASQLKDLMINANFEIVEIEFLHKCGQQYFVVAKKKS